jgi:DNA-binding transcriptional LysR family regulator
MELRHLRYFIAVAEELSFSRAAQRLNVSQPPLSRQIRDLESELNVKLFERNRHEVKLTRVGRALWARARELMREAELLRTHAHEMEGDLYEELELGYAPAPTAAIIAGILSRYHELAPGASVTLHDLSLSEILTALKAKRLHAGLTLRPRPEEMRGLKFEPLCRYSVGIICARSSPLAQLSVIRPSEVPMNKLIGYQAAEFSEYHQWVAKVLGVSKTRVTISQECWDRAHIRADLRSLGGGRHHQVRRGQRGSFRNTYPRSPQHWQPRQPTRMLPLLAVFHGKGPLPSAASWLLICSLKPCRCSGSM